MSRAKLIKNKKKTISKGHILCDSIYKIYSNGRILEMEKRLPQIKNVGKEGGGVMCYPFVIKDSTQEIFVEME